MHITPKSGHIKTFALANILSIVSSMTSRAVAFAVSTATSLQTPREYDFISSLNGSLRIAVINLFISFSSSSVSDSFNDPVTV